MKYTILLILAISVVSCFTGKNDYYVRYSGPVLISHVVMPDTVENLSNSQIVVNAEAHNGCWSNLNIQLTKNSSFDYSLEAFGIYESNGSCPDIMVYGDSTFVFHPTAAGTYKFHVTKDYNVIEIDTIIVR